MIEELEGREGEWKDTPMAARNKLLLKKWKEKIKVINRKKSTRCVITSVIIYKEMFLGCDWLIRVQLIPNITQNSAKICNTVQKSVTTVQKSVTTVQKSVISSLSDGIYSLKNQKYGGRIFTFA